MKFKVSELGNQFKNVHPILHNLVVWVDDYCLNKFKKEITITEIERTHEDSVRLYSSQINTKTKEFYKPDRINLKCCLYHKVGNDGVHFHLQVCDKTVEVN